jgi:uncharacterized protein YciI
MFIVLLRFAAQKARAGQFLEDHKRWIQRGLDEGVFLLAGSLQPQAGGVVLAHGLSAQALRDRVAEDPFVTENVVSAEIHEVTPSRVHERLGFLLSPAREGQ